MPTLIRTIDEVRIAVRQPVGYADVRQIWLRYRDLADHVDEVIVHILPYWDDLPDSSEPAVEAETAVATVDQLRKEFSHKTVIVGEVGWPTLGRQRGLMIPSRQFQMQFLRAFAARAASRGITYNVVEAIDQGWKAWQEGVAGGNWGLLDQSRRPKLTPAGTLSEDPDWPQHAIASVGLLFIGMSVTIIVARRHGGTVLFRKPTDIAIALSLNALAAFAIVSLWREVYTRNGALLAGLDAVGQFTFAAVTGVHIISRRQSVVSTTIIRDGSAATILAVAGALVFQSLLILDSGRDFPIYAFLVPVGAILWQIVLIGSRSWRHSYQLNSISCLLVTCSVVIVYREGYQNVQSDIWALMTFVMAAPGLVTLKMSRPDVPRWQAWSTVASGICILIAFGIYRSIVVDNESWNQSCLANADQTACTVRAIAIYAQHQELLGWMSLALLVWAIWSGRRAVAVATIIVGIGAILNWNANQGAFAAVAGVLCATRSRPATAFEWRHLRLLAQRLIV